MECYRCHKKGKQRIKILSRITGLFASYAFLGHFARECPQAASFGGQGGGGGGGMRGGGRGRGGGRSGKSKCCLRILSGFVHGRNLEVHFECTHSYPTILKLPAFQIVAIVAIVSVT